jgi:copper chaperone CopZ
MNKKYFNAAVIILFILVLSGCGKNDKESAGDNSDAVQTSGKEVTVEIHTSGMTCTGCESTIKKKVKKVDGVKDVMADFRTNTVKATYDDGKTNVEEIKKAISSAGYSVESVKQ